MLGGNALHIAIHAGSEGKTHYKFVKLYVQTTLLAMVRLFSEQ